MLNLNLSCHTMGKPMNRLILGICFGIAGVAMIATGALHIAEELRSSFRVARSTDSFGIYETTIRFHWLLVSAGGLANCLAGWWLLTSDETASQK